MCSSLGYAWANHYLLGVYMANIAEYDAKIYFWGMVLFATVSFIALPAVAFIYLDNKILSEQVKSDRRKTEQLKKQLEEQLKEGKREKPNPNSDTTSGVRGQIPIFLPRPQEFQYQTLSTPRLFVYTRLS